MQNLREETLVVAVTARTLFDLEWAHNIFLNDGREVYRAFQLKHEADPLKAGIGLPLVRRLLDLNRHSDQEPLIEVVLISRNDADSGIRVLNSARHYGLQLGRATFTGGRSMLPYLRALHVDLLLSAQDEDVTEALEAGFPAGRVLPAIEISEEESGEIRVAFDSGSDVFGGEPTALVRRGARPEASTDASAATPASFSRFLEAISRMQRLFIERNQPIPLRTALITSGDSTSDVRAARTLRNWNIELDESYFVGPDDKADVLAVFRPHVVFGGEDLMGAAAEWVPSTQVMAV
jgi:5'-nucleotidase